MRLTTYITVGLLLMMASGALAQEREPDGALQRYVERTDDSYHWTLKQTSQLGTSTVYELTLVSQTWRDVAWQHQLFLLIPAQLQSGHQHAMMFVAGGRWKAEYAQADYAARISKYQDVYASLADSLGTPLAVLKQVPFQPMFDGKREDALIAMTFDQYLNGGGEDWPLLLPMVKSVSRALDAVSELALQERGLALNTFTVTGASKRGWTSWLTAVADPRVTAIAPMVIDVLDMDRQLDYQSEVWGAPSEEIEDYTEISLRDRFRTERGQDLLRIVDPFSYLPQITEPKLLIIGTNDEYWPVDALNLYWEQMPEPRYHLYVPNGKHRLRDYPRMFGALRAINNHAAGVQTMPELQWQYEESPSGLGMRVSAPEANQLTVWIADAAQRDFRESTFKMRQVAGDGPQWQAQVSNPETGFRAVFAEVHFPGKDGVPFSLSTQMRVLVGNQPTR